MTFILLFSYLLLIVYSGLLLYYRFGWKQIPVFIATTPELEPATFISVLIPARNEANNLPVLLNSLLAQNYSKELFEVIVIDDHSTDLTVEIVRQYSNFKILSLKDFMPEGSINSYKKKAIEIGIQQARGELIVTTDADCVTESGWLKTIASFYETFRPELIVMPVSIHNNKRPIEVFQALDFMTLQGITGAAVHKKVHSMCNGANLAYTRKAFDTVNGFQGIDAIASGDDMLLMHKIAEQFPNGIAYLKSPDVIIRTAPVHGIKDFFNQRIRWASKADKYEDKRIFWVLLLVYFFNVVLLFIPVFILGAAVLGRMNNQIGCILKSWLILVSLKTFIELIFLYPVAQFFKKEKLLWYFPLAQPFHIVYTIIAGWLGKFGSYRWKERIVK